MAYWIAGVDVHKKMLAVVIADVVEGEYQFERRTVSTSPGALRALAAWLVEREVEEVVMESTAQYWRPVWEALERFWTPLRRTREGAGRALGHAASGPGTIESRGAGTEERLSGCRTPRATARCSRAHPQLCAGGRAAAVADGDAPQVPSDVSSRAAPEPSGMFTGGSAH